MRLPAKIGNRPRRSSRRRQRNGAQESVRQVSHIPWRAARRISQISTNARADHARSTCRQRGRSAAWLLTVASAAWAHSLPASYIFWTDRRIGPIRFSLKSISPTAEYASESVKLALIGTFGEMRLQQGKLHLAAATYEPFLDRATDQCGEPFWLDFQRGLCRLYYTWNRLPKIEHVSQQCLARFEHVDPAPIWLIETLLWLARIEQAQGQEKTADTAMHQALALVQISGEPDLHCPGEGSARADYACSATITECQYAGSKNVGLRPTIPRLTAAKSNISRLPES